MTPPLRLTLEEALAELGERNWGLRRWTFSDAPDWWQVMDGDGGVHGQGRAWPESVSVALGRPVVERDDTAALVAAVESGLHYIKWAEEHGHMGAPSSRTLIEAALARVRSEP